MKLNTHIILAIPTTPFARRSIQWIDAMASLQMGLGCALGRMWVEGDTIADARNALCEKVLESGADYIFFLADDVLPPANTLLTLLDRVGCEFEVENRQRARADLVTGVYWTKTYPPEPYLWQGLLRGSYKDWKAGEFFPIDLAGCDCLLIPRYVLETIPKPWFSTDWVWTDEQQRPSSIATEDFYFFTKAREAGFRLFADTSIQCLHEDRDTGQLFGLMQGMRQLESGQLPVLTNDEELLVAELGAGTDSPFFGEKCRVVRFDARSVGKPDVRCDLRAIPEQFFGTFDAVHSRHTLEHFSRVETSRLLTHWIRLLKVGGKLIINVPNIEWSMKVLLEQISASTAEKMYAWNQIYGGQQYDLDFHKNGFTPGKLERLFKTLPGLSQIAVETMNSDQNLQATAVLETLPTPAVVSNWLESAEAREHLIDDLVSSNGHQVETVDENGAATTNLGEFELVEAREV